MARLEGGYEQINLRLEGLERQIVALRQDFHEEVGELRRDMRNQFFWILGLMLPMWASIIIAVVLKS